MTFVKLAGGPEPGAFLHPKDLLNISDRQLNEEIGWWRGVSRPYGSPVRELADIMLAQVLQRAVVLQAYGALPHNKLPPGGMKRRLGAYAKEVVAGLALGRLLQQDGYAHQLRRGIVPLVDADIESRPDKPPFVAVYDYKDAAANMLPHFSPGGVPTWYGDGPLVVAVRIPPEPSKAFIARHGNVPQPLERVALRPYLLKDYIQQ